MTRKEFISFIESVTNSRGLALNVLDTVERQGIEWDRGYQDSEYHLLDLESIRSLKRYYRPPACVYFLFNASNRIIYIGESGNLWSRLASHFNRCRFKSFTIIPEGRRNRRDLERDYIYAFKPPLNTKGKECDMRSGVENNLQGIPTRFNVFKHQQSK